MLARPSESDLGHIRFPREFAKSGNFRGNPRFPGCQFSAISAHFGGFRANTEPTKSQRVTGAEMASVKKRGDVWGVRVSSGGRRESATFTTKREAEDWGRRRETELRREQDGTLGEVRTLRDALRRYAAEVAPTHKGERWETLRLGLLERDPVLPITLPLAKLTTAHLSAWKLERLKTVGPGSVLREISLLGSVLTAARREWHWMAHSPLADVVRPSQPAHRDRTITWSETRGMLRALGYRARGQQDSMSAITGAAFMLALRTGMRASEIAGLEWPRVHPSWLALPDTKNGQRRDVPLPRAAARLVQRMRGLDTERPFPVRVQSMDSLFRKARATAGLSGFRFHDARHTAATRIGRTVGQPGRLSFPEFLKVFGWRDPKFATVYVNPSAAELAARM